MGTDMVIREMIFILLIAITFGANDKSLRNANLDQGFRSYDLVMGDPYNALSDPGYKGHIFDPEDISSNLADHPKRSCSTQLKSEYYSESTRFMKDTITTQGSSYSMTIGPETTITGEVGANGVKVGASRKIPPLLTASSANSNTMQKTLNTLDSKEFSLTKTVASCSLHNFEILETQHPKFKKEFIQAIEDLSKCINDEKCVKKFFRNYGTHYIERGISGSKITAIKYYSLEEAASLKIGGVQECSKNDGTWSFFGLFGGGAVSTECKNTKTTNTNWKLNGLERSVTVTVGSAPKNSLVEWADQVTDTEIISKELRPLSDLFIDDFMKDVVNIPYKYMKRVLAEQIENYCNIFKDEQRCSFVVGFEISLKNCRLSAGFPSSVTAGKYTGPVNREFFASTTPYQVGVLKHGTSDELVYSGQWKNGCPVGPASIPISQSSCTWLKSRDWNLVLHCSGDEVAVGMCSGGKYRACNSNSYSHTLKCCKQEKYYNSNCKSYQSRWGIEISCQNRGGMLTGSCVSGGHADCHGDYNEAVCCHGFMQAQEVQVNYKTCHEFKSKGGQLNAGFGVNLVCGKDEVIVKKCGSGGNADCNKSSHTIVCCKLQYK